MIWSREAPSKSCSPDGGAGTPLAASALQAGKPDIGGTLTAVPEPPEVPASTNALLRSIRRWLLVVAFLLGVGVVTLADIGYITTRYQDGLLFALAGVAGGTVALVAGLKVLGSLVPEAGDESVAGERPDG